jgi:signal transduction histidine kinase
VRNFSPMTPPAALERRAAALRERREQIVERWERAVRASPLGPRLDGPALRDHVPDVLDRVASLLSPRQGLDGEPREHGRTRASQGVAIVSVLAELAVLRRVVLDLWATDGALELEAVHALDLVVDEAASEAARRIGEVHDAFFRGVDAISRASLESRDTGELLRRFLEEIVRTASAVDAAVILLREGDRLVVRAAVGGSVDLAGGRAQRVGEGFAGKVAAEGRPALLEDASRDPLAAGDALPRRDLRALYGVPLVHGSEVLGVALMGSARATGLEPEDRRLFESMVSRASLAVERQLAIDQERRHREELALLSRLSRDLVERMELSERLRRVVQSLVPAFADWCAVVVSDGAGVREVAVHAAEPGRAELARGLLARGIDLGAERGVARVLRDRAVELVGDAPAPARAGGGDEAALAGLRRLGLRSYLAVPLLTPAGVIGALAFGTVGARPALDEGSTQLALELGRRVAVAIENARLFENARREAALREHVLAVVSHDLRNPLSAVVMGASRLEAAEASRETLLRITGAIRRSARRMERLISDLLDVAAVQSGRLSVAPQPGSPAELVREAVEALKASAEQRGIALEAAAAAELPPVRADHDRILQVLGNLLSNALDVTPAGGRVDVRVETEDDSVRFVVTDTGPGLAPEDAERVFEPYRRGSAPGYKGTGLGLAIAQGIVAAHGGRIGVERAADRGAAFWFTLPVAAAEEAASAHGGRGRAGAGP